MENVPFVEGLLAELDDYREQLEQLGQVNLAAFDEFEELSKRHSELEAQRADLEDSVQSVRRAIAKMNRLCRQRFRDAFDAVNEQFTEAYPSLVGGGSARLALTDEEDLLETGVDIFVQPPGKRLQNLSLLSGGEKAMAAIALLLALFRVKPSPFCVLDEVDAPLDEANGARFNRMLREMSQFSQFLVITHNRKTMECADTLYGITMENPGVSRIVTVELGAY
jgi:chromosome segregation protein